MSFIPVTVTIQLTPEEVAAMDETCAAAGVWREAFISYAIKDRITQLKPALETFRVLNSIAKEKFSSD